MNRTRILPFLVAAVIFAGAAGPNELQDATKKGGISIAFPKNWRIDTNGQGATVLIAFGPKDHDPAGDVQASLSIAQKPGSKVDGAAQQNQLASTNGPDMSAYKPVDHAAAITINGLTGTTFSGTFTSGKLSLFSRQFIFTQNNQIYVITYTCLNSAAHNDALISESVHTFTLAK